MPDVVEQLRSENRQLRSRIELLEKGHVPVVCGSVALETSGTTTVVSAPFRCSVNSVIVLSPHDAGAVAEGIPQVVPAKGEFTITHTVSATARTYRYLLFTGI